MIGFDIELATGDFHLRAAFDSEDRISGLYGPSGSGKSTILLALAGLIRPRRGRIAVDGEVFFDSERGIDLTPERRRVGLVFQDGRLFPHMNVRENLSASRPAPGAAGPGFDEVVDLLHLEPILDRDVFRISGGEARRVAIARALLLKPRALLLDEPLTGLDPELRRRVLAYLLRLREKLNLGVFYVSHVFSDFLSLVDRVGLIREGTIDTSGAPESLIEIALAGVEPVETMFSGTVRAAGEGTARIDCEGLEIHGAVENGRAGESLYVTVGARDVLLGVGNVPLTSARNCLPGRVAGLHRAGDHLMARVEIGANMNLWAELTPAAADSLALEPGREVYALIKATAVRATRLS